MNDVYFVQQAYHNKTTGTWNKGIVIKDAENSDNKAAALQTFHSYLGAYAYGNNADIDYVYCRITSATNACEPIEEIWQSNI